MSRYTWSLIVLCLAAMGQLWGMGVLLVSRRIEMLLFGTLLACVFWAWCFWAYLLRKRRLGLVVTGGCLMLSLIFFVLCLLDMLDPSGVSMLRG